MDDQIQDVIITDNQQSKYLRQSNQPKHHAPKTRILSKIRRRKIIEACLDGKNVRDVAISTGLSPTSASAQVTDILKEPLVQHSFISIMEQEGLSDNFLAAKVYNLINAKKTEFFQKDGIVTDQREVEALETQRKTLELATKLKGHLKEQSQGDINIGLMQMVVQAVRSGEE